jgi:feruloyl esterase
LKARGGKILIWHGWADGAISAASSIGYYQHLVKVMGGRKATEDFVRLFLVPGVHHTGGGPGFSEFDAMSALERWVEQGDAPDHLVASQLTNGVVDRSRPVFAYPVVARYDGHGDPKHSSSFVPGDPTARGNGIK